MSLAAAAPVDTEAGISEPPTNNGGATASQSAGVGRGGSTQRQWQEAGTRLLLVLCSEATEALIGTGRRSTSHRQRARELGELARLDVSGHKCAGISVDNHSHIMRQNKNR